LLEQLSFTWHDGFLLLAEHRGYQCRESNSRGFALTGGNGTQIFDRYGRWAKSSSFVVTILSPFYRCLGPGILL